MTIRATTSGGNTTRIGYSTKRYRTPTRMRSPMTDQANRPHRAACATKGVGKKGPRSLLMGALPQLLSSQSAEGAHRHCNERGIPTPGSATGERGGSGRWVHFQLW